MEITVLGKQIEADQHAFVDLKNLLVEKYAWRENDARITVFNKCSRVLIPIHISYFLFTTYLLRKDWWRTHQHIPHDNKTILDTLNEFEMFLKIALIQNLMYAVESSFRIYVRRLDSAAGAGGNGEFKSIYEWLFKRLTLQHHAPLLDLWRNIRNVMHNNGLFFPPNMKNATVNFKDREYIFEVGKHNDFVTTEFIFGLVSEIRNMLAEVVQSAEIVKLKHIKEIS